MRRNPVRLRWRAAACGGAALLFGCGSSGGADATDAGPGGTGAAGGTTSGAGGGGAGLSIESGGIGGVSTMEADAGCRHDVSFAAVTLGAPQPFDLIIVADNSDSLSWSRNDLSAGVRDLLTDVQGRSVRVFLLTSTQYGASSSGVRLPFSNPAAVAFEDPGTHRPYANPMTTLTVDCTDPKGGTIPCPGAMEMVPYRATGTWQLVLPAPIAVVTPDMTAAEFAVQQKAVAEAIVALGGGGSPVEQPVCTLARYIGQDRSLLPDNAMFLVITDEDDTSLPKECLSGFTESAIATGVPSALPCTSGCDAYQYTARRDTHQHVLDIHCAAFDDLGNRIDGTTTDSTVIFPEMLSTCTGFSSGPCTDADIKESTPFCDGGKKLVGCDRQCQDNYVTCTVDLPDSSVDACKQPFTKGGTTYSSVGQYCANTFPADAWHDCTGTGVKFDTSQQSFSGGYSPIPVAPGTSTSDIIQYFRSQADSKLGREHYQVEAIALDAGFACKLSPGQSYAKNIADLVGNKSKLFPLCESYAPALSSVLDFAQTLVQTQFPLSLKKDEHLTSVHVVGKDGSDRALRSDEYAYDAGSQTLTVQRTALGAQDANLRVEVTSDCRPIIR